VDGRVRRAEITIGPKPQWMVSSMSWVWCLASRVLRSPSVSPPASPERAIFPSPSFTSPDCSRCWVFSAAYNLWLVSRIKRLLRRFDHSAIYLLIAATYTPFTVQMKSGLASGLLVGIWTIVAVGIVLKLVLPGRFDRLSLVFYLLLGWSGVMLYDVITSFPSSTVWLLAVGGALYSLGVVFHLWESLRFQNAIWHSFVVLAAACHYAAVFGFLGVTT
jgi:channel protein (hemolysin III family)